jgi:hypothetical protein
VDLAVKGAFDGKGIDQWHMASRIGGLIGEAPELRAYVYNLLTPDTPSPGLALLALAIAENPDEEGLLLLIKRELEHKHSFISRQTIESVVTKHVPAENWRGAFNTVPAPAAELRRQLLDMTTDGGPADAAARCLRQIDWIRDEYSAPESDPRHPDLASGRPWPFIRRCPT